MKLPVEGSIQPSVIFLMGFRQSGTTILSSLLGELDGFLNLGEVHNLWGRGSEAWSKCGCGVTVDKCPFWAEILSNGHMTRDSSVDDDSTNLDPTVLARLRADWLKRWHRRFADRDPAAAEVGDKYAEIMTSIYRRAAASGSSVLLDSSKKPAYAALLNRMTGVRSHLVHVIRDPRAGLWSQLRRPSTRSWHGERRSLVLGRVARSWLTANSQSERVARNHVRGSTIRIRYEDFMEDPKAVLLEIAALVDVVPNTLPLDGSHTALIGKHHTPGGNARVRFRSGSVQLRLDDEWETLLGPVARTSMTVVTAPLLIRYGYPLRP